MVKVGFVLSFNTMWMGGINYFKNLFFAIEKYEKNNIEIVLFVGKKNSSKFINDFKPYATIIQSSLFDKNSLLWFLDKFLTKFYKSDRILKILLKNNGVNIISHSHFAKIKGVKSLYWIPDFQHVHLKDMFTENEILSREKDFHEKIKYGDRIILSSYDALRDFNEFTNQQHLSKAKVLQFVSQPPKSYFNIETNDFQILKKKYNLDDDYIFLPNQFWKHKNHLVAFKAIKLLLDKGKQIMLVCTGAKNDFRNINYFEELDKYIFENDLNNYIKILGIIPYEDIFKLIRFSKFVLNPSLFEGWSSTLEECKSVGKPILLSNLPVHFEQNPKGVFFEKESYDDLHSKILEMFVDIPNYKDSEEKAKRDLDKRTKLFANKYVEIIQGLS